MANINNTNPDNPPKRYKPRKVDWDWRDNVINELQILGVPDVIASVAVIDHRQALDTCASNKLNAKQTAEMLISIVEQIYNNGMAYEASVAQRESTDL